MGGRPLVPDCIARPGRFVACGQEFGGPPSLLESIRQQAVIGCILGVRSGLASVNVANPTGAQAVQRDQALATLLLAQGNYQRAFEVATGFAEYFEIQKQGKKIGFSTSETAAVMMGHATGFNQAVETVKGETATGDELAGVDRFTKGLEALSRIASTVMTVAGGVELAGSRFGGVKVVSPIYRIAERDIVIVNTSVGRQAFYRSSGVSGFQ